MTWAILAVVVLLGAGMRFYRLGTLPRGLYHDEAFNGKDALGILDGERPVFFEANNGREPLFLYGMSLAIAVLGRTPFAVRVTAAILGTLTIPATYLLVREWFGGRVGLWSAVLIAGAPWPISLSRIGLRAVSMPLVATLALWVWWTSRQAKGRQRTVRLVIAGLLFGLCLYTYTAARLIAIALVAFALEQTWTRQADYTLSDWIVLALAAILAMTPMLVYGATHWESFAERVPQVSILNPAIHDGKPVELFVRNLFRAAGLFVYAGDSIPRHNVPFRPLFDPIVSCFFLLGALLFLGRFRRAPAFALALIWTGVMLVPTILAEDCPHFLRAVGVLPIAAVFPAYGLEWASRQLADRKLGWAGQILTGLVLVTSVAWGGYDYFWRHAQNPDDPEMGYAFEAAQLTEAIEINRFLGSGWQGTGIREPKAQGNPERHVYLGPRMWENRIAVNLLVASPDQVSILGRDPVVAADEVLALVWPYGDMSDVRKVLPTPARVEVWQGPLERGDLEANPRLLYIAFRATKPGDPAPAQVRFEEGIELVNWQAEATSNGQTRLSLHWRASQSLSTDYTVFVHLEHNGQVVDQDDRTPGAGTYATSWWRPGDEILDTHILDVPYDPAHDRFWVGWYELGSMQHLRVLDRDAQPGETRYALE